MTIEYDEKPLDQMTAADKKALSAKLRAEMAAPASPITAEDIQDLEALLRSIEPTV